MRRQRPINAQLLLVFNNSRLIYYSPSQGSGKYGALLNITLQLPEQCHWPGVYTYDSGEAGVNMHHFDARYGSAVLDLLWDWNTNKRQTNSTCYSVGFLFGFFQYENTAAENITIMSCSQNIETVNTKTTLLVPSLQIDPSNPPQVFEESRKIVAPNILYQLGPPIDSNLPDYRVAGFDDDPGSTGFFSIFN